MKNKILAIMLTTGMMTGMMAAPAAVSAADVNPLEQLVNEMSNQILPNPDAETAETTETDDGSSVLADAGNANDEIDPSTTAFLHQVQSLMSGFSSRMRQIQKRQQNRQELHRQKMSILQVKSLAPDRIHLVYGMEVLPERRLQYPSLVMEFIQSL